MGRAVKRLYADPSMSVAQIVGNTVMSLIISSLFYNLRKYWLRTEAYLQR